MQSLALLLHAVASCGSCSMLYLYHPKTSKHFDILWSYLNHIKSRDECRESRAAGNSCEAGLDAVTLCSELDLQKAPFRGHQRNHEQWVASWHIMAYRVAYGSSTTLDVWCMSTCCATCSTGCCNKAQISKSRAFHTKLSPRPSLPRTVSFSWHYLFFDIKTERVQ